MNLGKYDFKWEIHKERNTIISDQSDFNASMCFPTVGSLQDRIGRLIVWGCASIKWSGLVLCLQRGLELLLKEWKCFLRLRIIGELMMRFFKKRN